MILTAPPNIITPPLYGFIKKTGYCFLTTLLLWSNTGIAAPSFSCENASTFTEKRICSNKELATIDSQLFKAYSKFLKELPEEHRNTAKKMQQLWIRERDIWCNQQTPKPFFKETFDEYDDAADLPNNFSIELYQMPPENKDLCLKNYYLNALDALKRGALISRAFLNDDRNRVHVGINSVQQIEISPEFTPPKKFDYDTNLAKNIAIQTATEKLELTQGKKIGCDNACSESEVHIPLELRFYLTKSGNIFNGIVNYSAYHGGRCGHYAETKLQFFSAGTSLEYYSLPESSDGINLRFTGYACWMGKMRYHDWGTDKNGLIFSTQQSNTGYPYYTLLVNLERYAVNITNKKVETLPSVDTSTSTLWGVPYSSIVASINAQVKPSPKSKNTCQAVSSAIDDYLQIKGIASNKYISNAQALFVLNNVMDNSFIKHASPNFDVAAKVFLNYLNKIRTVKNWQEKLNSATKKYPDFSTGGLGGWPNDIHPFMEVGFYSDKGCMRDTPSPSYGVEEWIYRFWARRYKEQQLESVESALKTYLRLRNTPI